MQKYQRLDSRLCNSQSRKLANFINASDQIRIKAGTIELKFGNMTLIQLQCS